METLHLIFKRFLPKIGREIITLISISILVGFFLFATEFLFIYALQGFFSNLGFITFNDSSLPSWYPKDPNFNILIVLLVGCLRVTTQASRKYISGYTHQFFMRKFRTKFFASSIYDNNSTSTFEMINLFTDNLSRVGAFLLYITSLTISGTSVLFLFISGMVIAPQEMLVGIGGILLFIYPIRLIDEKVKKLGGDLTNSWKNISKDLVDGMRNHYFFKAHGLEELVVTNGSHSIRSYELGYRKYFLYLGIKNSVPALAGIIVIICISYYSYKYSLDKATAIVPLLYIFLRISQGLADCSANMSQLILNHDSVVEFLNWNKNIEESQERVKRFSNTNRKELNELKIKAQNISFQYDDVKVLDNLSFDLSKKDILVIKGHSGSGKSTLLSLLLGLNSPNSGNLTLNEKKLDTEIGLYRDHISYVGPDPMLFVGTIRENLLYGNKDQENISDDMIYDALSKVGLTKFIKDKDNQLEFILKQNAEASTGQRQRLSLARSLLRKPSILIMDEATANLDEKIEKEILEEILKEKNNMLIVIVTHKPNLNTYGNKFIDLDNKKVELERRL
jgi:ABC-type multidrug transport system fused ATPase/permease subunit